MKIVITGGSGFIGSNLARKLVKKGHSIVILDNFETSSLSNISSILKKVNLESGSILDSEFLGKVFKNIDAVFHFAAKVAVGDSFDGESVYQRVNVEGTKNVLEIALKNKVKKVVFASSAAVYGNSDKIPLCETRKTKPISPLGITKLRAEQLCRVYKKKGLDVVVLRFFNAYGYGQYQSYQSFVDTVLNNCMNNKPVSIYGDGKQTRDFIYIDDIIRSCLLLLDRKTHGEYIFNIGSGVENTLYAVVELIKKTTFSNSRVEHFTKRTGDIKRSCACICKAQKFLGFKPTIDIAEGIDKTYLQYKENY